jgi:hypothetical protein
MCAILLMIVIFVLFSIFCQESQGAQRLVGPRVISCISKKYAMENTYDVAEDMLQKDESSESNENNLLDEESEKLQEEEEGKGGALAGTGGTEQQGDDSAGVPGQDAEERNVGQKRRKSAPVGLDLVPYVPRKRKQTAFFGKGI